MKNSPKRLWAFLSSPFGLMVIGTIVASLLIPRWSAIWQDRQPELELKAGLVDKVAQSTTQTVRDAISLVPLAARPSPSKTVGPRYMSLKKRWLITRAELLTTIGTYFSEEVARCWFLFSDRITDYVSLPQPGVSSAGAARDLLRYVTDPQASCEPLNEVPMYSQDRYEKLRKGIGDFSALSNVKAKGFKTPYSSLGELLLIDRDRVVKTIVAANANGFAHGWWIFH